MEEEESEKREINHLSINKEKTLFSLSYSKGIKIYSLIDFKERHCINDIGKIKFCLLLGETNMVILVGDENNDNIKENEICIYNILEKEIISNKIQFDYNIKEIKQIDNTYIVIKSNHMLFIYKIKDLKEIIYIKEKFLEDLEQESFEIWNTIIENIKYFALCYINKEQVYISFYLYDNLDEEENELIISNPFEKIQNIYYINELNQFFLIDEYGCLAYSYSYNKEEIIEQNHLCRGDDYGIITSMTVFGEKYLAVCNLNRTIHIFNLKKEESKFGLFNFFRGFYYDKDLIEPCYRIYFYKNDNIIKEDDSLYKNDFMNSGALIANEINNNKILNIIPYNGFGYKLVLDVSNKNRIITNILKYLES